MALVDLWNRGVLDVVVANQKGPLLIYKNNVAPENKWIEFELEGTASNRSAIGAEVRLFWNGRQQGADRFRVAAVLFAEPARLHFGSGRIRKSRRLRFAGHQEKIETIDKPAVGQVYKIKESA